MTDLTDRQKQILRGVAPTGGDGTYTRPQHPEGAWGEQDEDYTPEDQHWSWGRGRDEYEDKYKPEDIKIRDRKNEK